jgi:hypothetical protein
LVPSAAANTMAAAGTAVRSVARGACQRSSRPTSPQNETAGSSHAAMNAAASPATKNQRSRRSPSQTIRSVASRATMAAKAAGQWFVKVTA